MQSNEEHNDLVSALSCWQVSCVGCLRDVLHEVLKMLCFASFCMSPHPDQARIGHQGTFVPGFQRILGCQPWRAEQGLHTMSSVSLAAAAPGQAYDVPAATCCCMDARHSASVASACILLYTRNQMCSSRPCLQHSLPLLHSQFACNVPSYCDCWCFLL